MGGYKKPDFVPNTKFMSKDKSSDFDKLCKDCKFWVKDERHKNEGKKNKFCPANSSFKLCTKCKMSGHKTEECGKNGNDKKNSNNDRDNKKNQNSNSDSNNNTWASDGRVPFATNNGNNSKNDRVDKNLRGLVAIQSSTHYPVDLSKGETSKIAEKAYCAYCNEQGHWTHKCEDYHSIARHNRSALACTACHSRGHTIDECQCPISEPCAKCAKRGHATSECRSNKEASVYDQYFNKTGWAKRDPHGSRFQWSSDGIILHEAQLKRQQYLLDQAEFLAQDKTFSPEYKRARQKSIEDAERGIFDKKLQVVDSMSDIEYSTPRRTSNVRARLNTNYIPSNPTPTYPRSTINTTTINNQYASDLSLIRQMASKGASRTTCHQYEAALHSLRTSQISSVEHSVRKKCLYSRKLSPLQNMNYKILQNETSILENSILSLARMNEVKMALYQGVQIYRDPKAMEALFARQVPRDICGSTFCEYSRRLRSGGCFVGGFGYERRFVIEGLGGLDVMHEVGLFYGKYMAVLGEHMRDGWVGFYECHGSGKFWEHYVSKNLIKSTPLEGAHIPILAHFLASPFPNLISQCDMFGLRNSSPQIATWR
ncbi:uncharacterized protein MYCFIDRAFT_174127 [Pseudocercospora fijiensis CIRAD86]|uniref:CCHC-type domain-containing protein n=1 Tax=Pseudocercospora fijiensis (strain CIRAD86) TaxID=383855 RepID=M3ADE4_PSEFD|nr:uncharacterized protein MYCFIDRAFT_174127 [Pseudocercospora fijiensis CIRAD86]EME82566.1 hypothetical protein MYCFIDRAFT_174127 [Pseudocercospora fijiensis CIRAD86]